MNVKKFQSCKATIECRFNLKQQRFRCHLAAGKRRVGPIFVRLSEDHDEDAADAARVAIERAPDGECCYVKFVVSACD
jgi:hypothetical protein